MAMLLARLALALVFAVAGVAKLLDLAGRDRPCAILGCLKGRRRFSGYCCQSLKSPSR
jgi:uncharacterized membrane protein YphA (DoxX/SURF4 family)